MASEYNVQICKKLTDIDKVQLSKIFAGAESDGTDRTFEWLKIVEKNCSGNIEPYYFVVYHKEKIIGLLVSIFALKLDFEYESIKGIDKGPINVLRIDTLMCNFPLSNFFGFFIKEDKHKEIFLKLFFEEMENNLKPGGFYFGPFEEKEIESFGKMIPEEFLKIPYLNSAYMDVEFNSFEEYLGTLKKKYRWDVRNKIKIFEDSGAVFEYCTDIINCADDLLPLFLNTIEKHKEMKFPFNFTSQFFKDLSPYLGKRFEIILIKKAGKIIAFGIIINKKDFVELKFIGLDYDLSHESAAYFNLFFEVIRLAIKNKVKKIYFGTTGLYNKKRIGCKLLNQYVFMGGYPLKIFRMFKKSGMFEKKFVSEDYFTKQED